MSNLLWQPSPDAIAKTQMMHFIGYINEKHALSLTTYAELYQWSIDFSELFWEAIFNFCNVKYSKKWDHILTHKEKMPGAKWFSGAQLNFAENLLRHSRTEKNAIVFCNEQGMRQTLTFPELYLEVAKFAAALKKHGIQAGDRVAAVMPNLPQTIVALLATASIGAIFSSCSPDFGTHGLFDRFNQISPKILIATDGYFYNGKDYRILEKINELGKQITSLEKIVILPYVETAPDLSAFDHATLYKDFLDHSAKNIVFTPLPFDHPLYILYSSGTTGIPKCIVHGTGGTLLQHLKEHTLHVDLKTSDTIFYFTTCGWMMWNWLVSALATGATLVLYDGSPFYPKRSALFELIEQEKITVFGTSAKFISAVEKFKLYPNKNFQLNTLRTILSTGSPLLPDSFDFVYKHIKKDVCLSSISGGTDIVSCFALGNPILPVYRGELQCRGLGLKVEIFDAAGKPVRQQKGELVCTAPFPAMPIYFWNDKDMAKYTAAYFETFPGVWAHGDYAELTEHDGLIIYGRSDTVLKPAGIRIGTAEIYREVEKIPHVLESIAIGQEWKNDIRIILFVKLEDGFKLSYDMKDKIKNAIKYHISPHHVPAKIIQVMDIPRTLNGKIMELAVSDVVHHREIKNKDAISNPEALVFFKDLDDLEY